MTVVAVIVAVAAGATAGRLWWRQAARRARVAAVEMAGGEPAVVLVDHGARLMSSTILTVPRMAPARAGTLAATRHRLVFVSSSLRLQVNIPRASIGEVTVGRSHLDVDFDRAAVLVDWTHDGQQHSTAWRVTDPARWVAVLSR